MKKLSLNMKIAGVLAIFVIAAIVISEVSLFKMGVINELLSEITSVLNKRVEYASTVRDLQRQIALAEAGILLKEGKAQLDEETKKIDDLNARMKETFAEWDKIATDVARAKFKDYNSHLAEWMGYIRQEYRLVSAGQRKEAIELSNTKGWEVRKTMFPIIDGIIEMNKKWMDEADAKADAAFAQARVSLAIISVVSILVGLVLAFSILRAVSRSISRVILDLDNNSSQVTSASQQIAAASTQLSQATTEQAASLEETSSAIEELNSMLQKNAENANRSADLSAASQKNAEKGQQVVQEMIAAIDEINSSNTGIVNQINDSNQQISEIVKLISEIGNKTKVINDIVFQTKLLSFNASVEAARAGEHGKGFAVVAEEVGNLAQMSGNAAKEISEMLEGSISKVEGIVNDTKSKVENLVSTCREKVETGTSVAKECGEVLNEIVGNVTKVSEMVGEISQACKEQAQGIREITTAVNQLDQVTQQNAATSEEAASSAEELSAQAESLKGVVGVLISTIQGAKGEQAARAAVHTPAPLASKPAHAANSKILHWKNKASGASRASVGDGPAPLVKKVSGLEGIPASNDPNFEDV